jgi:hypothetical protein
MLTGIREGVNNEFTDSEKVRFQFAVACTLVYELVHIFWWWSRGSLWKNESTRLDQNLVNRGNTGHLGLGYVTQENLYPSIRSGILQTSSHGVIAIMFRTQ